MAVEIPVADADGGELRWPGKWPDRQNTREGRNAPVAVAPADGAEQKLRFDPVIVLMLVRQLSDGQVISKVRAFFFSA